MCLNTQVVVRKNLSRQADSIDPDQIVLSRAEWLERALVAVWQQIFNGSACLIIGIVIDID